MPKFSANDFRVRIESATPGTYNEIAGQTGFDLPMGEQSFDVSDKASTVQISQRAMRTVGPLGLDIIPDLPDANGYTRAESFYISGATILVQVVRTGTPTVVFQCAMRVASLSWNGPLNSPKSAKMSFVPTAAPTVNLLA